MVWHGMLCCGKIGYGSYRVLLGMLVWYGIVYIIYIYMIGYGICYCRDWDGMVGYVRAFGRVWP